MTDLRQRVHDARVLFHCLNGILGELSKRAARVERGEVNEILVIRELAVALDRLAVVGECMNVPNTAQLRRALLGVICACDELTNAAETDSEVTHA